MFQTSYSFGNKAMELNLILSSKTEDQQLRYKNTLILKTAESKTWRLHSRKLGPSDQRLQNHSRFSDRSSGCKIEDEDRRRGEAGGAGQKGGRVARSAERLRESTTFHFDLYSDESISKHLRKHKRIKCYVNRSMFGNN